MLFKEIVIFSELFLGISIIYLVMHCTFLAVQNKYPLIQTSVLYLSVLSIFFSVYLVFNEPLNVLELSCLNNTFINDYTSFLSKLIIGNLSVFCLLMMQSYILNQKINNFEYFLLILFAILGLFLLCSANDFLTAYLAIELQSLSFYVLAAFKKNSTFSVDAGIKYFILGAFASSMFLFGSSLLYGVTGTVNFDDFRILFMGDFPKNNFIEDVDLAINILDTSKITIDFIEDLLESLECKKVLNTSEILSELLSYKIDKLVDIFYKPGDFPKNSIEDVDLAINLLDTSKITIDFIEDLLESLECKKVLNTSEILSELLSYEIDELVDNYKPGDFPKNSIIEDVDLAINLLDTSKIPIDFIEDLLESLECKKVLNTSEILSELLSYEIDELVDNYKPETVNFYSDNINLIKFALVFILIGLFFKITVAPFHIWAPDVYEGSPTSSTFFFSVVPKLAIFVLLLRIFYYSFFSFVDSWRHFVVLVVIFSIIVGSFGGLEQRKLKSLLVYSTISHMGYSLISFSAGTFESLQMLLSYLIVYSFSGLCVWSIFLVTNLKNNYFQKQNKDLTDLVLLGKSNYMLAIFFTTVLFSIAGFPPMIGFLVKMGIFLTAMESSMYFVALISILCSVIGTFYYIRLIKILYFEKVLVGKLYYPINFQNSVLITFLFFLLLFLFVNPTLLFLISHKFSLLVFI